VIVAAGGATTALAAKAATTTIPIVFIVSEDPVRVGLVASLGRPGGNLTGINFLSAELVAKRLELLRELVPAANRVAVLVNPAGPGFENTLRDVEPAARTMGLQIQVLKASTSGEINVAFATFLRERPDALFVGTDPFFTSRRAQMVQLAARHMVPATYHARHYPEIGGLMYYGSNGLGGLRSRGAFNRRDLRGRKPVDFAGGTTSKLRWVDTA